MEPAQPARVRHVWVLGAFNAAPRPGLVIAWRQVAQLAGPSLWQAMVVHVDDRYGTTQAEWVFANYLVPVKSKPPAIP
ncbi:hypothetical protein [Nocardioides marmorisolisilvae]|uniref:hypothetical protein n=1 Tax=Nocardioides marmorisolisilvae TaxID=1542737 RepID=UPI0011CE6569|nr:hypothetical protein [Nocardioides marmorisolisilvae]